MQKHKIRIESDSLGDVKVPAASYYGAQTQRAKENFVVSGIEFPAIFIKHLAVLKKSAAISNRELGEITEKTAGAIIKAADEIIQGKFSDQFPVDIFQTGSGTSTNMNMNEVIANRANELLGGKKGDKSPVHPNDHVNKSQSSNDVIPTVMHITSYHLIKTELIPNIQSMIEAFEKKSVEFSDVIKLGRTHLQDAVPVTLGLEFRGYKTQLSKRLDLIKLTAEELLELALGGTAVGTGLNAHKKFASTAIKHINTELNYNFREASDHFEAQSAKEAIADVSAAVRNLSLSLEKILNDIRLMAAGPRAGFAEIMLPTVQPGSSIMPGKVNPVIIESSLQALLQVQGSDFIISRATAQGQLELNTMMPLIAHHLFSAVTLMSSAARNFTEKCLLGIKANRERSRELLDASLALVTPLVKKIGYDAAAEIALQAYNENKTLLEVLKEDKNLSDSEIENVLSPESMLPE